MTPDETPSTNDDNPQQDDAPNSETGETNEAPEPWWANDPTLAAKRQEVWDWLESIEDMEPVSLRDDQFSAIHREVSTGACRQELRLAREDLARARKRHADAIVAARAVGYSWGEIGELLGVSRQSLHRRYRDGDH